VPTQTGLSTTNGRSGGGPFTLEVRVKFTLDAPARLSAIAFYKDGAETGTHVGRLQGGARRLGSGLALQHSVACKEESVTAHDLTPTSLSVSCKRENVAMQDLTPGG
jgi:hypothetical protein